jgi:soluble lytic murein transglycosylase
MGTAGRPWWKRRKTLIILVCIVLAVAAVAGGCLWAAYRSYPYKFKDSVESYAGQYGLSPLLVAAVIRSESSWNPDAVSGAGAAGLMQIMPSTGSWIAQKNGWDYSDVMLLDASYNIRLGCWYLNYLSDKFDGDATRILAAYNAGPNKVLKWDAEGRFQDGHLDIPIPETKNYVRKVLDAYEKYKFLYGGR